MDRDAMRSLIKWKDSKRRKPLILSGARQVGKTWLLKEFGKTHFNNVAYINFDNNQHMPSAFEGSLSPKRLIPILQAESGERIEPEKTLIILDEIQEVPRALTALKYFQEEAAEYLVVAAGSSLGIALHGVSFPVGKVSFLELYPLTISEFLQALGLGIHVDSIRNLDWDTLHPFHEELIELVRMYIYVGGMPEAVSEFAETRDFNTVREIQQELLTSYEKDFSKHADEVMAERLRLIWKSIPANLSQENKKFVFKRIKPSARARGFEEGLQWLEDASLIHRVKRVNTPRVPLASYQDDEAFKVYCLDVGLLGAMTNLPAQTILEDDKVFKEFKGALGEQLALQEVCSTGRNGLNYYQNESTRTEIDFVLDGVKNIGGVVPLEVKYGTNLRAKSLASYVKRYEPELAMRASSSSRSKDGAIEDVPFYALAQFLGQGGERNGIAELPAIASKREAEKKGSSDRVSDAILKLLCKAPLTRKEILGLLLERMGMSLEPQTASQILAKLNRAGEIVSKGFGVKARWEISEKNEND
ncbi:MAG: AAA family ATPase [Coriobacteriia bacterium]|nr:AAA family ATPase [Coriobacteriia bacterium]